MSFDPNFNLVTLLYHLDTANTASNQGIDSGPLAPPTLIAGVQYTLNTSIYKFGVASAGMSFTSILEMGNPVAPVTLDHTIEGWFYPTSASQMQVVNIYSTPVSNLDVQSLSGELTGTAYGVAIPSVVGSLPLNQWTHVAVVVQSGQVAVFSNGAVILPFTTQTQAGASASGLDFGIYAPSGGRNWAGNIDELRVTKGLARYTAAFTPPTAAFPNEGIPTVDPNFSSLALLLTCDGANASTTFTDTSNHALAVTAVGAAQVATLTPKFGTGALLLASGTDALTTPLVAAGPLDLGNPTTNDFTVEFWYFDTGTASGVKTFYSHGTVGNAGAFSLGIDYTSGMIRAIGSLVAGTTVHIQNQMYQWVHVAYVVHGGVEQFYINGTASGLPHSATSGAMTTSGLAYVGNDSTGEPLTGYMDQVMVYKGVAKYTANFTPPIATNVAGFVAPNVVGETLATAETNIAAAFFSVGIITTAYSSTVAIGSVISTNPVAGTLVGSYNSPMDLVTSLGAAPGPVASVPLLVLDEFVPPAYFGGVLNLVEFTYFPTRPEDTSLDLGPNMIINRYKQQPTDSRQRGVDFTNFLLPGEKITSVTLGGISVTQGPPVPTALSVTAILVDPLGLKFAYVVTGGQDGYEYQVQFVVTTTAQGVSVEEIFNINIMIQDEFP